MSDVKKPKKPKSIPVPQLMAGIREEGYKIRIHHIRYFPWMASFSKNTTNDPAHDAENIQQYMTRGQYNQAMEDKTLCIHVTDVNDMDRYNSEKSPTYGEAVSPRGGWTRVTIEKEGAIITFGKKSFGRNRNFCRKKGVYCAFKMAYNILRATQKPQGISEERI